MGLSFLTKPALLPLLRGQNQNGSNTYAISKFVGHSGTKMIEQVYGHLRSEYLQEQMGRVQIIGTSGQGGAPSAKPPAVSSPADGRERGQLRIVGE